MTRLNAKAIENAVRELITAEETSLGIEVLSLVAYPGGDLVNVVVEQTHSAILVHDASFAAMRLSEQGIAISRHVRRRLTDYAKRFECTLDGDRVCTTTDTNSIGYAVAMVANASRSVADYALEIKRHAEADFRSILVDALRDVVGSRLRENEEFNGGSGRNYRVSAVVLDEAESSPRAFVAPIPSHSAVEHAFAMFSDLRRQFGGVLNESVYDESGDVREEDRKFLGTVSDDVTPLMQAQLHFRKLIGVPAGHG